MKFQTRAVQVDTVDATRATAGKHSAVQDFLLFHGVASEVTQIDIPNETGGEGSEIRIKILGNAPRTLVHTMPCWIVIHATGWVDVMGEAEFRYKFTSPWRETYSR